MTTLRRPAASAKLALAMGCVWLAAASGCGQTPSGGARARIAVIPKGTTQVFWKSVEHGARRAAESTGLAMTWKGPLEESDRAQQIQLVQQYVTEGVDGIVLAPLDARALLAPVRQAGRAGIPVVIFDSALDGTVGRDFISFVATDNEAGGRMAGEHVAGLLADGGKVVLLRYQVGSASTEAREQGFLAALAAQPRITVTVDNRYAGANAGEAKQAALNLIDRLREADAAFCPNESTTYGMLLALQQEGLSGKVALVGFDASPPLVAALRAGAIAALVVQDPERMGREAVLQLHRHLAGEPVAPAVDTGATLVTAANLDQPTIQALLK